MKALKKCHGIKVIKDSTDNNKQEGEKMEDWEVNLIIDEMGEGDAEEKTWFCNDCNMGPIDEEKTKCPRCGFKHHSHREKDVELDDFGEPIDEDFYEKHY